MQWDATGGYTLGVTVPESMRASVHLQGPGNLGLVVSTQSIGQIHVTFRTVRSNTAMRLHGRLCRLWTAQ
jgi:hypothetical protein